VRLLLDTHIVLCQLSGEKSLSDAAREAISDADDLLFSAVSFAEIGVKVAGGKLVVPAGLSKVVETSGLRVLNLSAAHGLAVAELPMHHRDPFDRLLIAQAMVEGLGLVTADRRFAEYSIRVVYAG
jgi:PIN domain nuclease of toxin-antitoxin system